MDLWEEKVYALALTNKSPSFPVPSHPMSAVSHVGKFQQTVNRLQYLRFLVHSDAISTTNPLPFVVVNLVLVVGHILTAAAPMGGSRLLVVSWEEEPIVRVPVTRSWLFQAHSRHLSVAMNARPL